MNKLFKFAERLGMDVASLVLLLVISFAILGFLANKFSGNVIGQGASWLESRATPQG
jgi:hypothetical protein